MGEMGSLVPIHKWPICPISALPEKFNPRNINHMPAVKFFARLDLDQICLFLDGHSLATIPGEATGEVRQGLEITGTLCQEDPGHKVPDPSNYPLKYQFCQQLPPRP